MGCRTAAFLAEAAVSSLGQTGRPAAVDAGASFAPGTSLQFRNNRKAGSRYEKAYDAWHRYTSSLGRRIDPSCASMLEVCNGDASCDASAVAMRRHLDLPAFPPSC